MTESGEAAEGLIPKIQAGLDKYTKGAVTVIDKQNGGLHSTYEILEQLSKVYPTLTDEAKAYVNESVAGNRQNKVLVAIMENWNNVESATKSAMNSLGSASRENEIYLDSIQGKLAQFQSTAQKLWYNTIDSSSIKSIVDFGTGVLKVVDAFGLLNTSIIVATTALLLFNKGFLAFYNANIASLFSGLSEVIQYKLVASLGMGKAAAIGLAGAINLIAPMAVIAGIMLLIKGIKWLSEAHERQAEKVRELKEEYDTLTRSLEETEEKQSAVRGRLKELYNLRDSNDITQGEKDELTRLENINAELNRQIDYEKTLKAIRGAELEEETLKLSSHKTEKSKDKYSIGNILGGSMASFFASDMTVDEKAQESIETVKEYTSAIEELNKAYENDKDAEKYKKQLDELTKSRTDSIIELDDLIKRLEEENTVYNDGTEAGTARRKANELIIASAQEMITALGAEDAEIQKLLASLRDVKEESEGAGDSQSKLAEKIREAQEEFRKYGDATKTLTTALKEMSKGDLSENTIDKLVSSHKELIPYLNDRAKLQEKINELIEEESQKQQADRTKEAADAYNDVTNSIQSLYKIQDELNKSQKISGDITETIIKQHPELIAHLGDRISLEKAISQAIATQEQVQSQAYNNMLMNSTTYFNEQIKGNKTLWNTISDAYGKDAENFKTLAEAKDKTDVFLVNAVGERWKKLYGTQENALRALINASDGFTTSNIRSEKFALKNPVLRKRLRDAQRQLKALEAVSKAVSFTAKGINFKGINLSGIKSGSGSSASKAAQKIYKPIIDAYQKISTELDRINALLEKNSILTEQAEGSNKITLLKKRVALIKQQENALKRLNTQQKKELNTVKSSLKKKGFQFNSAGDLTNYAQRLSKLTGDAAQEAEELIDRFSELAYGIIPDTNNQILSLGQSVKDIANELEGYVDNVKNLLYEAVKNKYQIEQQIQEAKANIEGLISNARKEELQQRAQQLQDDADFYAERLSELKEFYNREKDLLRKQLQDLKDARDDEKQQEELIKLQNRYNQISLDNSGMFEKEKLDLQQRIADIQEDQYWDALEKNVKAREEEIDSKILLAEQEQEKRVNIAKNAQEAIEESEKKHYAFIQSIMKKGWSGILAYLKANSTQYKNATVTERKIIEQQWQDSYNTMLNKHTDYWTETENLFKKSTSNILTFLKKYSPDFADLGESQGKAYADALRSQINLAKGADTTSVSKIKANTFTSSSGSTSSGSKSTTITQTLKKGAKGSQVSELQRLLNKLGYKVAVDGSFGGETLKAVKAFQKDRGLSVDGSVGKLTREALYSSSSSKPKVSSITQTLKKGAKNSNVKKLQQALNQILGTKLAVDGSFGSATEKAVKQFQKKYGLTQDGSVGKKTKAKFKTLGYSEGGLVDSTGLAMLHGSKSKPEVVLNAQQTAIFKDFTKFLNNLVPKTNTNFLKSPASATSLTGAGSLIGSLVIQVEKLESDTDFDLLGKKVGDSIYKIAKDYGLQFSVPRRR